MTQGHDAMRQPPPADAGDWPFEPDPEVEAVVLDESAESAPDAPLVGPIPVWTSEVASAPRVADHLERTAAVARLGIGVFASLLAAAEVLRDWPSVGAIGFVRFAAVAGGGVLGGVVVCGWLVALATLVRASTERSQSLDRIAARLDALAAAVEAGVGFGASGVPRTGADTLAEIRQAIRSAKWEEADRLIEGFAAARPELAAHHFGGISIGYISPKVLFEQLSRVNLLYFN